MQFNRQQSNGCRNQYSVQNTSPLLIILLTWNLNSARLYFFLTHLLIHEWFICWFSNIAKRSILEYWNMYKKMCIDADEFHIMFPSLPVARSYCDIRVSWNGWHTDCCSTCPLCCIRRGASCQGYCLRIFRQTICHWGERSWDGFAQTKSGQVDFSTAEQRWPSFLPNIIGP